MSQRPDPQQAARIDAIVDEFVTRYHGDDPLRAEDVVDAHPEIAEELAQRLAVAERLLGCPANEAEHAPTSTGTTGNTSITTPGLAIEGYDVGHMLHHGGQGIVYQARQRSTNRTVALKLLLGGASAPAISKRRFAREVALLAHLEHPHIVTIFDSGITPDGIPFYVMDYVDGRSLNDHVRAARLSIRSTVGLFETVCRAVNYAHQRAVIHRDLKPSNILVDKDGQPRLLDFGLAKVVGDAVQPSITASHHVAGTFAYMSPEQARGSADIDTRSDVYALGVILHEILTGRQLLEDGRSPPEILRLITETPSAPPSQRWNPKSGATATLSRRGTRDDRCPIDHELDTIVIKALAKEPDRRYQSAAALADDIERYLHGWAIDAKRDSRWYVLRKTARRHRAIIAIGAAAAALVIAFAAAMTVLYFDAQAQRELAEQRTREARAAKESAETQRVRADERAEELRRNVYFHSIALAQNAYEERNITQLKRLLRDCPPDLRGWEWRYLWKQSDTSSVTLRGHSDSVTKVTCFPDGEHVASASRDGSVRTWSLSDAGPRRTLLEQAAGLEALALSPDCAILATGGHRRTIDLWDAETGELVGTLTGHQGTVTALAFSPSGVQLVSGGQDDQLIVWNVDTRAARLRLAGHEGEVLCAAFSPDGRLIASGGADETLRLWDEKTGNEITALRGHTGRVTAVAFDSQGSTLLSGGWDRTVRLWAVASGEQILHLDHEDANVNAVAFSPDGRRILSASYHSLRLWSADDGELESTLLGHENGALTTAFTPDGRHIVSGGHDATLKIWDTRRALNLQELHVLDSVVDGVAIAPDGDRIAAAARDGVVTLWTTAANEPMARWTDYSATELTFAPDGRLLASAGRDGSIRVWDTITGATLNSVAAHHGRVTSVAYSPDGDYLASAGTDRNIRLWQSDTGDLMATLSGHDAEVTCVSYCPTSRRLASASSDRTVKLWDLATRTQLNVLRGHSRTVNHVAFSPDGARLVSGSEDRTARVWDVESGELLHELIGHQAVVMSVEFSPDGRRILSAGYDAELRIWDSLSGQLTLTLSGHRGPVNCAAFSPDGSWIASGSVDQSVRIWKAPPVAQ